MLAALNSLTPDEMLAATPRSAKPGPTAQTQLAPPSVELPCLTPDQEQRAAAQQHELGGSASLLALRRISRAQADYSRLLYEYKHVALEVQQGRRPAGGAALPLLSSPPRATAARASATAQPLESVGSSVSPPLDATMQLLHALSPDKNVLEGGEEVDNPAPALEPTEDGGAVQAGEADGGDVFQLMHAAPDPLPDLSMLSPPQLMAPMLPSVEADAEKAVLLGDQDEVLTPKNCDEDSGEVQKVQQDEVMVPVEAASVSSVQDGQHAEDVAEGSAADYAAAIKCDGEAPQEAGSIAAAAAAAEAAQAPARALAVLNSANLRQIFVTRDIMRRYHVFSEIVLILGSPDAAIASTELAKPQHRSILRGALVSILDGKTRRLRFVVNASYLNHSLFLEVDGIPGLVAAMDISNQVSFPQDPRQAAEPDEVSELIDWLNAHRGGWRPLRDDLVATAWGLNVSEKLWMDACPPEDIERAITSTGDPRALSDSQKTYLAAACAYLHEWMIFKHGGKPPGHAFLGRFVQVSPQPKQTPPPPPPPQGSFELISMDLEARKAALTVDNRNALLENGNLEKLSGFVFFNDVRKSESPDPEPVPVPVPVRVLSLEVTPPPPQKKKKG